MILNKKQLRVKTGTTFIECEFCKTTFKKISSKKSQKFCSRNCFKNSKQVKFVCQTCNKIEFLPKWEARSKAFCSPKCNGESIKKQKRKELICKTCETPFVVMGYMANRSTYCSISCSSNRKDKPINLNLKKIKFDCKTCNKEFKVWNYRKNVSFCSRLCKHNHGRFFGCCKRCNTNYYEEKNVVSNNLIRKFYCKDCMKYIPSCHNSGFQLDVYDAFIINFTDVHIDFNKHLKFEKRIIWPDLIINKKIIVECQGDYYHCNPNLYDKAYFHVKRNMTASEIWEKDFNRKKFLNENGYVVYYIWEKDWKTDKNVVIEDIKKYIYDI